MYTIELTQAAYHCYCAEGFSVDRPTGPSDCAFVHFLRPMTLWLDGQPISVPEGSFIFYIHGTYQRYRPRTRDMLEHWCHFRCEGFSGYLQSLGLPLNRPFEVSDTALVDHIFHSVVEEFHSKSEYSIQSASFAFNAMLHMLASSYLRRQSADPVQKKLQNLRTEMSLDLSADWTLASMAERVSFSVPRFCVLYRNQFGISPKQDLKLLRIERAKYLLSSTRLTIAQIADNLNYTSSTSFISIFSRAAGMTPGAYRKSRSG